MSGNPWRRRSATAAVIALGFAAVALPSKPTEAAFRGVVAGVDLSHAVAQPGVVAIRSWGGGRCWGCGGFHRFGGFGRFDRDDFRRSRFGRFDRDDLHRFGFRDWR